VCETCIKQVNGVEMSGKSQEEVVNYLRSIKFGSVVNIIVSRTDSERAGQQAPPTSTTVISSVLIIVLIYGVRGYRYPHFVDWGVPYPTVQDEKMKNLLSPAVSRGDLRRWNYSKTARTPLGELMTLSLKSQSRMGGVNFSPFSSPCLGPKGASFSFWIGTLTF